MRKARLRFLLTVAAAVTTAAGCAAQPHGGSAAETPGISSAQRHALAARYLAIAIAGNRHLEHDFDSLKGMAGRNLAAARADLRDAAATEKLFDRRLLTISFPQRMEAVARLLVYLNESRAKLTLAAAMLPTLQRLHADKPALNAANRPVEQEVRLLRRALGLPSPASS